MLDVRWVVTSRGVELTATECSSCHVHVLDDGAVMYAGPAGRFASDGMPLVPPGIPVLQMFAGVFLQHVLRAATLHPAEWLKRDQEIGRLLAGRRADLVLVRADPLVDMSTLRSPVLVVQAGTIRRRDQAPRAR